MGKAIKKIQVFSKRNRHIVTSEEDKYSIYGWNIYKTSRGERIHPSSED